MVCHPENGYLLRKPRILLPMEDKSAVHSNQVSIPTLEDW